MDNSELLQEIEKWNSIFSATDNIEPAIYELAFFKIFIKFEKFLSNCFENYSIGIESIHGYKPKRKLEFEDINHLNKVIKKENLSFVNHYEVIKTKSDCFFIDNPFEILTTDATYTTTINQMKVLRDYIAHESQSSKIKYEQQVLNNKPFIPPSEYLLKKNPKKNQTTNYTIYIKSIKIMSNYIINSPTT